MMQSKPKEMLWLLLAGKQDEISTGLAVVQVASGTQLVGVDTAQVYFRPYDEEVVNAYIETGDSLDKAGGYGVQSGAAPLISHIEGHYDTIIGLPTRFRSPDFLSRLGVEARVLPNSSPQSSSGCPNPVILAAQAVLILPAHRGKLLSAVAAN